MKKTLLGAAVGLVALGLMAGGAGTANATVDMQKKAKAAGVEVAELPALPRREAPQEGRLHDERPRQVAHGREGQAEGQGGGRRLAQGVRRAQEVA